ncbi:MAG: Gfo/Idh/MocA family protein [Tepidimonas sp.]|uniref:Gfo/Idh/MocA family protein n=1 Tax=Tepidimonas sp. TaxID=2002775 RepID=UPI004054B0B8
METQAKVRTLKVGVIGCGYWGPKHARNLHELPGAELAWVADLDAKRLGHMQGLYPQVRATRDYRELLASDVEAVVIATPVRTHHALALEALRAGKHVLVEKPLAATGEQAQEIAETAERLGLVAMVGHTFQHNPAVNAVRELIARGELGRVYYINATRVNLGLLQPDINVMWDLAPHDVSILLHVLGLEPFQVSASGQAYIQKRQRLHEVAYLNLHFPGSILANVRVSWLDPVKQRRITIVGSRKMLVYDDIAEDKVVLYDKGVEVPPYSDTPEEFHLSYRHGPTTVVPVPWEEPLRLECRAFVDWITTGRPACSDAWMGVRVVRILEAAQKSLLNGGGRENVDL